MPAAVKQPTVAQKRVVCTYCGKPTEVGQRAMSIFCPHCKKRLILEDFKITSYYAVREFFTCGDIVVERKGHVVAPIKVGHLTIRGKVQGSVLARAGVTIGKTGWFKGQIESPSLHVEKGAVMDGFISIGTFVGDTAERTGP